MDLLVWGAAAAVVAGLVTWLGWLVVRANDRTRSKAVAESLRSLQHDLDSATAALEELGGTVGDEGYSREPRPAPVEDMTATLGEITQIVAKLEGPRIIRRQEGPDPFDFVIKLGDVGAGKSALAAYVVDYPTLMHGIFTSRLPGPTMESEPYLRILATLVRTETLWTILVESPLLHALTGQRSWWAIQGRLPGPYGYRPMYESTRAAWTWLKGRLDVADESDRQLDRERPTVQHPLHWTHAAARRGRPRSRHAKTAAGL
jgi:hypothetical protein